MDFWNQNWKFDKNEKIFLEWFQKFLENPSW